MAKQPNIDIHAHFFPEPYLKMLEEEGEPYGIGVDRSRPEGLYVSIQDAFQGPLRKAFTDLDERVKEMDCQGVDIHALSVTRPMLYWADGPLGLKLAQCVNDALVEAHSAFPDRLVGLAILPMQAPELAIKELERCSGLPGICGIYMGTNIDGRDLSDPGFFSIFEKIEQLDLPVFLHPINGLPSERLKPFYFYNLLGFPFETAMAVAHLIFAGVLDRFPHLKICLPHAGGLLPYLVGRMNRGREIWEECSVSKHRPSTYLKRFMYDTISHDPELLLYLIRLVGPERILLGSDYCFKIGYERPVQVVTGLASLSQAEQESILGGNAARLLKLK